jgi:hypothetical protein
MKNLIGLWPNLFRAIEIAITGKYSISIFFEKDYINGFSDYKKLKSFVKDFLKIL